MPLWRFIPPGISISNIINSNATRINLMIVRNPCSHAAAQIRREWLHLQSRAQLRHGRLLESSPSGSFRHGFGIA